MEQRSMGEIIADLQVFDIQGDYLSRLGRLTDEVLASDSPEEALDVMLGILERYPEEEMGAPGPLVHAIEQCMGYERKLLNSVERQPGVMSVWMVYRLLREEREVEYLEALRAVLTNPRAGELVREDVEILLSQFLRVM